MAKDDKRKADKVEDKNNMTLEEAKAYRASKHVPQDEKLTDEQKREQFRLFWAQAKRKYGQPKGLEDILWLHLKSSKHDEPSQFEAGIAHFGLKKVN